MKSLVLCGAGGAATARERQRAGATVLAWGEGAEADLRRAGVAGEAAAVLLGKEHAQWRDLAVEAWISAWPQVPFIDGRSFAEEATWKGESLGWCAEAFFRRSGRSARHVALVESFRRLLEATAPDEAEAVGLAPDETLLLGRLCTTLGILFHGPAAAARPPSRFLARRAREAAAALGETLRPQRPVAAIPGATVLWLLGEEARPPAPDAGPAPLRPDVGRYSRWRVFSEVRRARAQFRHQWRRLRASPGLQDLFRHRGVAFADLGQRDLAELMLLELPRAVRRFEEVAATLRALGPSLVLLAASDKAEQAACRASGVPFAFFRGFKDRAAEAERATGVVG